MAKESFYLIHPKKHSSALLPTFIAFGRWLTPPGPLTGEINDSKKSVIHAKGKVIRNDPHLWAMLFTVNPPDGKKNFDGMTFDLSITNCNTKDNMTVTGLNIAFGHPYINITYPTVDDLPLGSTFITYGSTDVTSGMSAYLTPTSGTVRTLFEPPDAAPYWAFEFSDVDIGMYTLSVLGGTSQQNRDIDVL